MIMKHTKDFTLSLNFAVVMRNLFNVMKTARMRAHRQMQLPMYGTTTVTAKSRAGFTLIETFVAITVLAFAIVGPLTIASRGLNATVLSRDQLTATYLAQEAIEEARFMRDTNVLRGAGWLDGALTAECLNKDCTVDVWDATPLAECDGTCPVLKYDSASRRYQYSTGEDTSFRRIVRVEDTPQVFEKVISVRVEWQSGPRQHSVEVHDRIFDWISGLL